MAWPLFANTWLRRGIFGALAVIFGVLTLWPQPYLARAQLLPNSTGGMLSSLLGGATGGGGLLQSLLGGGQSADVDLDLARSEQVLLDVAAQLRAKGGPLAANDPQALEKLHHTADIEVVRGGILQISVTHHDRQYAKDVVQAFVDAVTRRVASLSMEQTNQRSATVSTMMRDATTRLQQAQAAMDQFRGQYHLAAPEFILGAAVARLTGLQANLTAEQAALDHILRFATPQSFEVQSAQARIAALQKEIVQAQIEPQTPLGGANLQGLTPKITTYENLYRNLTFATAEYEVFKKYREALVAETLSASQGMNVIQQPYISTARQYNMRPLGLLALVLLIAVCAEFYVAKPPPGEGR